MSRHSRAGGNPVSSFSGQKAVNLGDALDGVPGIHASQYGGGASAPVIRG
ncbi:Plug domain-containing protein, partial [Neisseria meningitidis]|nr:Plug domain-containing protein [Neisseria meningitidis]